VKNCRLFSGFPSPFHWPDYLEATGSLAVPDECFSKVSSTYVCLLFECTGLLVSLFAHRLALLFYDNVANWIPAFTFLRWWNKYTASVWLLN